MAIPFGLQAVEFPNKIDFIFWMVILFELLPLLEAKIQGF
jgi:hypothetical protein